MATEIRQISFSDLRRHGRHELKFVTEEMGHLWLTFHGKPRAVIIPLRDEAILHKAIGLDVREALHRAHVDHSRMVSAIEERGTWRSTPVITQERGYPPMGQSQAAVDVDPRTLRAQEIAAMYADGT